MQKLSAVHAWSHIRMHLFLSGPRHVKDTSEILMRQEYDRRLFYIDLRVLERKCPVSYLYDPCLVKNDRKIETNGEIALLSAKEPPGAQFWIREMSAGSISGTVGMFPAGEGRESSLSYDLAEVSVRPVSPVLSHPWPGAELHFWPLGREIRNWSVLVRVSIPAQTSWPRSKLWRKGFIHLTVLHCCSSLKEVRTGTQAGQEAGADGEAMEGCFLLACFPWLAHPALI